MSGVSGLALGTVQFGIAYGLAGLVSPVPESEVRAILERASRAGVTRLDTAPAYGDIEARLGRLVGDLPFSVVSKIPSLPEGLSVKECQTFVSAMIDRSHARLGGLLVGLLFHDASAVQGDGGGGLWGTAAEACDRLGVALGVSGYAPAEVAALAESYPLAMVQLPGNAFDQRISRVENALPDTEITLRSIFLQGLLLMSEADAVLRVPAAAAALANWHEWCRARGLTQLDAAIATGKAIPDALYHVVGVDGLEQFEQIADAWTRVGPISGPELSQSAFDVIDPRRWPRAA